MNKGTAFSHGWQWAYKMLKGGYSVDVIEAELDNARFVLGQDYAKGAAAGVEDYIEEMKFVNEMTAADSEGGHCD